MILSDKMHMLISVLRYLTKICHQTMALVADNHAKRIVWGAEDESESDGESVSDRVFSFEIAKTKEKYEGVTSQPGFTVRLQRLQLSI
jgi:hypothetical protein